MLSAISRLIVGACIAAICVTPVVYMYLAFNLDTLELIAKSTLGLPIQWNTVNAGQWYALLGLTFVYHSIGLACLYVLYKAFRNFARGELFNQSNSLNLRRFALFLFIQAVLKPVHFTLASVILSLNHPAGQKLLSILIGSDELKIILLAGIMWVVSELIIKARVFEEENKQFI